MGLPGFGGHSVVVNNDEDKSEPPATCRMIGEFIVDKAKFPPVEETKNTGAIHGATIRRGRRKGFLMDRASY